MLKRIWSERGQFPVYRIGWGTRHRMMASSTSRWVAG